MAYLDIIFRFLLLHKESLSNLLRFLNTFQENILSIKPFEVDDLSDLIFFYVVSRVIDPTIKQMFEFEYDSDISNLDVILDYTNSLSSILNSTIFQPIQPKIKQFPRKSQSTLITVSMNDTLAYVLCHVYVIHIYYINVWNPRNRYHLKFTKANNLCTNCLSPQHRIVNLCVHVVVLV